MALLHRATLTPPKSQLVAAWLPSRPWFTGGAVTAARPVGTFRLDDPAGEVGLEWLLLETAGAGEWNVPMTYRAAPLEGAGDHLIGILEHSVLGTRHVYDASVTRCSSRSCMRRSATEVVRRTSSGTWETGGVSRSRTR